MASQGVLALPPNSPPCPLPPLLGTHSKLPQNYTAQTQRTRVGRVCQTYGFFQLRMRDTAHIRDLGRVKGQRSNQTRFLPVVCCCRLSKVGCICPIKFACHCRLFRCTDGNCLLSFGCFKLIIEFEQIQFIRSRAINQLSVAVLFPRCY